MSMRSIALLLALLSAHASAELRPDLTPMLGMPPAADFAPTILPDGSGLPAGSGSAVAGEMLYRSTCAACHGLGGQQAGNALVGGKGTLLEPQGVRTIGSYWPYATTLYDYIATAMPYGNEKSLDTDETYAIVAYLLFLNGIVTHDTRLDEKSLPRIEMPNRDRFFTAEGYNATGVR